MLLTCGKRCSVTGSAWYVLQLPTDLHGARRHSDGGRPNESTVECTVRRRSLQPTPTSQSAVVDTAAQCGFTDASQHGSRRRSFCVTAKGDVVNQGDEILPQKGLIHLIHYSHPYCLLSSAKYNQVNVTRHSTQVKLKCTVICHVAKYCSQKSLRLATRSFYSNLVY